MEECSLPSIDKIEYSKIIQNKQDNANEIHLLRMNRGGREGGYTLVSGLHMLLQLLVGLKAVFQPKFNGRGQIQNQIIKLKIIEFCCTYMYLVYFRKRT
jgi:hypothetical protein